MSNPLRAPKIDATEIVGFPDAYFVPTDEFEVWRSKGRDVAFMQKQLDGLDMDLMPSFYLPKEWSVEEAVLRKVGPALAVAKTGKATFRVRSGFARKLLGPVWKALPDTGFGSKERVKSAVLDRFSVDGGSEVTLGRLKKAYPKVGARIASPVLQWEAERALDNCGLRVDHLPQHAVRPYPLLAREGEGAITVNPRADNGFPVQGKWSTEGASTKVLQLAVTVRKEIVEASRGAGVREWKRRQEDEAPWLVACRGKAKGDYYSAAKINAAALRFYNALPRQIMLNMQVATQPLEAMSRHILEGSHSGIGVSLVHGGGHQIVNVLDAQLRELGYGYVHVGDDSWVVVRVGSELVWFALDCSNFDLTQHATATQEVHRAIWRQLRYIDAAAADLWYEYARERVVVVAGALVRRFKHAGPSGMPLQSKVNDMLMDVLVQRVLASSCDWSESAVDEVLTKVGADLGFTVRVEQYGRMRADTLVEVLEQEPFLFIGYYFHARGGRVMVCTDVPRTLAQMPYPGLKWMRTNKEVEVSEAMRLGSMVLSQGIPPRSLEAAFSAWRAEALKLLDAVLEKYGEQESEALRWAVGETPWGPEVIPSLTGLRKALMRDPRSLWLEEEVELPAVSDMVLGSWADEVEAFEQQRVQAKEEYVPPPEASLPRAPLLRRPPAPTHPATRANDGRPPPTARWAPDKAPRERVEYTQKRTHVRRGRVLDDEPEEEWWWEESEEYSE